MAQTITLNPTTVAEGDTDKVLFTDTHVLIAEGIQFLSGDLSLKVTKAILDGKEILFDQPYIPGWGVVDETRPLDPGDDYDFDPAWEEESLALCRATNAVCY